MPTQPCRNRALRPPGRPIARRMAKEPAVYRELVASLQRQVETQALVVGPDAASTLVPNYVEHHTARFAAISPRLAVFQIKSWKAGRRSSPFRFLTMARMC